MRSFVRAGLALAALIPAALVLAQSPAAPVPMMQPLPSPTPPGPPKPPCVRDTVVLLDPVDTAKALPGDTFRIQTVENVTTNDGIAVPLGTIGYGVVAIAHHAERGGKGGYAVIEMRYLALPDGRHVQATTDWKEAANAVATGKSRNIPGLVGWIPFSGYVLGPYGFLHHGSDITIERGARIEVLLGDEVASRGCLEPVAPTERPAATSEPDRDVERRQEIESPPPQTAPPQPAPSQPQTAPSAQPT